MTPELRDAIELARGDHVAGEGVTANVIRRVSFERVARILLRFAEEYPDDSMTLRELRDELQNSARQKPET